MSNLQEWINAALLVAEAEGMEDEVVINTWPQSCVKSFPDMYPQLTVGALREWQAASAQDGGEPVGIVELSDYMLFGTDRKKAVAELYDGALQSLPVGTNLYTHPPSAVVPDERGTNQYGLDVGYFRKLFNRELSSLRSFRPDELARVLARAARTADASVLQESEFQCGAVVPDWEIEAKRAFWSGLEIGSSMGSVAILPRWDEYIAKRKGEISARPPSAVVPDGRKLVPVEPTPEMREAFFGAQEECETFKGRHGPAMPDHQWAAMLAAAPQQPVQGQWVPTQDTETRWILGRPCFVCAGIAQNLRAKGYEIERKAEDEQAVVIDWMLSLYAKHGPDWRSEAESFLAAPPEQEQES
jgi:hypothetical protein